MSTKLISKAYEAIENSVSSGSKYLNEVVSKLSEHSTIERRDYDEGNIILSLSLNQVPTGKIFALSSPHTYINIKKSSILSAAPVYYTVLSLVHEDIKLEEQIIKRISKINELILSTGLKEATSKIVNEIITTQDNYLLVPR